jgi:hypothetical protein
MKDPKNNPVSGNGLLSSLFKNSKEGKFRWERFFTFVGDKGLSSSYFIHFLVIVAGWWGIAKYLKKRKAKKEASKYAKQSFTSPVPDNEWTMIQQRL